MGGTYPLLYIWKLPTPGTANKEMVGARYMQVAKSPLINKDTVKTPHENVGMP